MNFTKPDLTLYLMRYTKYFIGVLKHQGVPNLNIEQYSRLMNIVSLEGRIQELLDLKKAIQNPDEQYKYDVRIHKLSNKLKGLTCDEYPKDVLQNMLFKSN